jgi:hypothetical protein
MRLAQQWTGGWLAFETLGEKRRLAPYPAEWADFTEEQLAELCSSAIHVPRSRRPVD